MGHGHVNYWTAARRCGLEDPNEIGVGDPRIEWLQEYFQSAARQEAFEVEASLLMSEAYASELEIAE
jgi:hypothetical protein